MPDARAPPLKPGAEQELSCCFFSLLLVMMFLLMAFVFFILVKFGRSEYSFESHGGYFIAIDSVSCLTPATNPCRPVLDPAFNLTLRVIAANQTSVCLEAGTYLEVSYRCVKLATSAPLEQRLCVEPAKSIEEKLVTRATGVSVPWTVLDSLREDIRRGPGVFQVRFFQSGGEFADDRFLTSCGPRWVGASAAGLTTRCDGWRHCLWHHEW